MENVNSLLRFCTDYSYVYCYGAGNYGLCAARFLDKYGIKIDGFIVSEKSDDYALGVKIYQIDEIIEEIKGYTGIVLSLSEKYHEEVLANFLNYGIMDSAIFFRMTQDMFVKMQRDLAGGTSYFSEKNSDKYKCIHSLTEHASRLEFKKAAGCRSRYKEIRSKYKKIIYAQYYMRHIGEMCLTYYIWHIENKGQDDILYAMYPVIFDDDYSKIPNTYFFKKIQEKIEIITDENYEFWRWMLQNHGDEIEISNRYEWVALKNRDMDYIDSNEVCFQVELDSKEQEIVDKMNLRDPFVCIFNRDVKYYKAIGQEEDRDTTIARNSSIFDYNLLAEVYKEKNIPLVRMGYEVEEQIETEGIIDYASRYRTEKLDFYLLSKCKFFVVSASGIMSIARLFSTPLAGVNMPILSFGGDMVQPMSPDKDLIIMKKLWHPKQGRYLSLDEILYMEGRYKSYELFNAYQALGVVFRSNSPEELLDIAEEMRNWLQGTLVYSAEDEELQKRYRTILERNIRENGNHYYNGRFGRDFLRKNLWFLEEVPKESSIRNILDKRIDIVRFMGGMGNQMFQYALVEALRSRGREVGCSLDAYKNNPDERPFVLDKVFLGLDLNDVEDLVWQEINDRWNKIKSDEKAIEAYKQNIKSRFFYKEEKDCAFDENIFRTSECTFYGYWQSEKYFLDIKSKLQDVFSFHVTDSKLEAFANKLKDNYFSIHVRVGDYSTASNRKLFGGICTTQYYLAAMEYIKSRVADAKFIIFSNEMDGISADITQMKDVELFDRSGFSTYQDWYDMYLMSRCKGNIIANSSFGWWGAWLNRTPDKIVVAPRIWINGQETPDIWCDGWVRL